MRCQFYHAIALCALLAPACGRPLPDTAVPPTTAAPAPVRATGPAVPATPTSDGVTRGKEIIERIRAAAGGPKLTAIRSIEATGTSTLSVLAGARTLNIRAMYPEFYRQEEIPTGRGGFGVAIGLGPERTGWMLGARIGGRGLNQPQALQDAYSRSASQAMAGFLAGVNAPWLVDSGQFTPVASGTVDSGDDRSLLIVNIEGPLGRAGRLLIDPGTNLPRRFIEPPQEGPGGEAARNEFNFTYSDFRDVDGVLLPHTIVRRIGNVMTTWAIAHYTLNPKLRAVEFTRRIAANVR